MQFNPRYLDFARHYGFQIVACNVAKGNEKGRVERGVGYVKHHFLNGLDLPAFAALNPAVRVWLESVANVRLHRETHHRPVDLRAEERAFLQPLNPRLFDVGRVLAVRAHRQFRVTFDRNRYSVPARFAGCPVTLKAYPDRLCVYYEDTLIARHVRSFERYRDIADPDHAKALVAQRRHAHDANVLQRFLGLSPLAANYHRGLLERRGNALTITECVLQQQLQRLQLPYFVQYYPDLTEQAAREAWTHGRFLEHLVAGEIARRVKAARLPGIKTLDGFDWTWPKKINRAQRQHLFRLEFLPHGNVILLGGVGVGKTHLAIALAYTACLQGKTALFTSAVDIVNALAAAQATGGIKREMARLLKPSLLVIDELGYLPIDKFGADGLFQVISQRYERGSTVITTHRAFKQWPEIFNNDSTLTSALLDRLLHHAESVVIEGRSYRMRDQTDD